MPSIDRPFVAMGGHLPPWMDGPLIKRIAKNFGLSYEEAKDFLRRKEKAQKTGRMAIIESDTLT